MKIIGFGHRSGHGKDTVAKLFDIEIRTSCPGLRVKRISFADKLKDVTYQLFQWAGIHPPVYYDNHREARSDKIEALGGITIVDLWVLVGEKMRVVYERTWLDYVLKTDHKAELILVADVRHPNEANAIIDAGGFIYHVDNPRVPKREGHSIDHMLEGFDRFTGKIVNDEGLKELNKKVVPIAQSIIEQWGLKRGKNL